jgi:hypothetical protein
MASPPLTRTKAIRREASMYSRLADHQQTLAFDCLAFFGISSLTLQTSTGI